MGIKFSIWFWDKKKIYGLWIVKSWLQKKFRLFWVRVPLIVKIDLKYYFFEYDNSYTKWKPQLSWQERFCFKIFLKCLNALNITKRVAFKAPVQLCDHFPFHPKSKTLVKCQMLYTILNVKTVTPLTLANRLEYVVIECTNTMEVTPTVACLFTSN